MENQKEIALVYMVAGISSRFGGKIKAFAEVGPNNETLLEYSLNQALPAGFNKIILIVGEKTQEPFKQKFGDNYKGTPIQYVLQKYDSTIRQRPWGTTDAVCATEKVIDGPFVVCNGDDIYGKEAFKILYNHLKENSTEATIGYKLETVLPEKGEYNRGIFKIDPLTNNITSIKEVLGISRENLSENNISIKDLCSMNVFAFQKQTLDYLCEIVRNFKEQHKLDTKIECLLPQEIGNLIKDEKITMKLYPTEEKWFGISHPEDVEIVKQELKIF